MTRLKELADKLYDAIADKSGNPHREDLPSIAELFELASLAREVSCGFPDTPCAALNTATAREMIARFDAELPPRRLDPMTGMPVVAVNGQFRQVSKHGAVHDHGYCRSCNAHVCWVITPAGKKMPVDVATDESHFATCKQADHWRKPR